MHETMSTTDCQQLAEFDAQPLAAQLLDIAHMVHNEKSREVLLEEVGNATPDALERGLNRIAFSLRFEQWSRDHLGQAVMAMIEEWDYSRICKAMY